MFSETLPLVLPFPEIDPEIVRIGPIAIRWYSMAYIAGIVLAWLYIRKLMEIPKLWAWTKKNKPPFEKALLEDFMFWAAIGVILGGRLGYIFFYALPYHFDAYLANPLKIFAVWEGGMSFHGGFLGVIIATIVFCRRRGIDTFLMADLLAGAAPIGLFFGRVANFINGELWGRPSDVSWAMVFPTGGPEPRHPSQLYEAGLEGLALFGFIWLLTFQFGLLAKRGFLAGVFFAWYGVARILVEFFRDSPTRPFGPEHWLTQGMVLSSVMVAVGAWFIYRSYLPENSTERLAHTSKLTAQTSNKTSTSKKPKSKP